MFFCEICDWNEYLILIILHLKWKWTEKFIDNKFIRDHNIDRNQFYERKEILRSLTCRFTYTINGGNRLLVYPLQSLKLCYLFWNLVILQGRSAYGESFHTYIFTTFHILIENMLLGYHSFSRTFNITVNYSFEYKMFKPKVF